MIEKSDKYITSEEKLLKLIRRKDQKAVAKPAAGKSKTIGIPKFLADLAGPQRDWIALFNKVLTVVIAVLAAFLLIKTVFVGSDPLSETMTGNPGAPEENAEVLKTEQKPLDSYLSVVDKRDVFNTSFEAPVTTSSNTATIETPSIASNDPRQFLRLVGIVMDNHPQAIIENIQEKQTYFLYQHEKINNVVVENILEGKVVLSYDGQTYELTNQ